VSFKWLVEAKKFIEYNFQHNNQLCNFFIIFKTLLHLLLTQSPDLRVYTALFITSSLTQIIVGYLF
jgi:hypothetical protein